jgi:hypothetical protein
MLSALQGGYQPLYPVRIHLKYNSNHHKLKRDRLCQTRLSPTRGITPTRILSQTPERPHASRTLDKAIPCPTITSRRRAQAQGCTGGTFQ